MTSISSVILLSVYSVLCHSFYDITNTNLLVSQVKKKQYCIIMDIFFTFCFCVGLFLFIFLFFIVHWCPWVSWEHVLVSDLYWQKGHMTRGSLPPSNLSSCSQQNIFECRFSVLASNWQPRWVAKTFESAAGPPPLLWLFCFWSFLFDSSFEVFALLEFFGQYSGLALIC